MTTSAAPVRFPTHLLRLTYTDNRDVNQRDVVDRVLVYDDEYLDAVLDEFAYEYAAADPGTSVFVEVVWLVGEGVTLGSDAYWYALTTGEGTVTTTVYADDSDQDRPKSYEEWACQPRP